MSDKQTPAYLTTEEASDLSGMTEAWFERGRWRGDGPPYVKLGAAVRYPVDDLHAFMRARLRISTTDDPVSIEPAAEKFSPQLSAPRKLLRAQTRDAKPGVRKRRRKEQPAEPAVA